MDTRILVTGFGPFPGVKINPTARLMARVVARLARAPGLQASGGRLTVTYAAARAELRDLTRRRRPDAILLLGLAARARWVRVERFARLNDSPLHPDAVGRGGGAEARAVGDGLLPLKATAALEPALAALRRAGLRARLSPSAGRYLCNAVYAEALGAAAGRPVLFIHVPWPRAHAGPAPRRRIKPWRPSPVALERALTQVARGLAIAARRFEMARRSLA
jgi:pyroglutamyl-peptidase